MLVVEQKLENSLWTIFKWDIFKQKFSAFLVSIWVLCEKRKEVIFDYLTLFRLLFEFKTFATTFERALTYLFIFEYNLHSLQNRTTHIISIDFTYTVYTLKIFNNTLPCKAIDEEIILLSFCCKASSYFSGCATSI